MTKRIVLEQQQKEVEERIAWIEQDILNSEKETNVKLLELQGPNQKEVERDLNAIRIKIDNLGFKRRNQIALRDGIRRQLMVIHPARFEMQWAIRRALGQAISTKQIWMHTSAQKLQDSFSHHS